MPKAGRGHEGTPSAFPEGGALYPRGRRLVKQYAAPYCRLMVTRAQLLVLGLTAGVTGSLVGGLMLGIGLGLVVNNVHAGWVLVLPAAPVSGLLGYWQGKRLARDAGL